jgi:hypothetical protein
MTVGSLYNDRLLAVILTDNALDGSISLDLGRLAA